MAGETVTYPAVTDGQQDLIDRYGGLLVNTGGNDPRDLLQRFHDEKYLAATNMVVFTLAVSVKSQLSLLAVMDEKGMLTDSPARGIEPGAMVVKINEGRRGQVARRVLSVGCFPEGEPFLTLDLVAFESDRFPQSDYRIVEGD